MRLLPCGRAAILIEFDDRHARRRLATALSERAWDEVADVVPADLTVLVRAAPGTALTDLARRIRDLLSECAGDRKATSADHRAAPRIHEVPVRYDGPDLAFVSEHLRITVPELVARHTGQDWTVEFAGFTPGFAYLIGATGGLQVPRRASPRTVVPAGAVALAGEYSGIYPSESPGGWHVIGHTEVRPWSVNRGEPALFAPADVVRFVIAR